MADRYGILSFGGYVPRRRLPRALAGAANAWFAPALSRGQGERSFAGWDEDSITMAVEAARDCLGGLNQSPQQLRLVSTTLPFAERSNSGVVCDALGLGSEVGNQDVGGSLRAATSELARLARDASEVPSLLVAADCADALPASEDEQFLGHGAAALLLGSGSPVAEILGSGSVRADLVDRYRASGARFDYVLESRWIRDEGYLKIVPEAVEAALADANVGAGSIQGLLMPAPRSVAGRVARQCGLEAAEMQGELDSEVGNCGVAQPLLMLARALEQASAGQRLLLVGFGQGCDALVIEITEEIDAVRAARGPGKFIDHRREEDNYTRYLTLRGLLALNRGIRAERDNRTAQSAFYRKRDQVTGFLGGRCDQCNTLQFPRTNVCVKCGAGDSQQPESLSDRTGTVRSFTEDWQAFTPDPPLIFGNVGFEDGANVMMEFADFESGELQVGTPVRMVFRIKNIDEQRGFRRYFWKPAPVLEASDG